jgi:precorrin-6B C5,15-methyltransferase / cobalt-precorrin-6B C5,C15-methyltransferase
MTMPLDTRLDAIRARYAEPHRHYHATTHLDALLRLFAEIRPLLHDAEAVQLAIFYHDAIYQPDRPDNEAASAALMRADLDGLVEVGTLARAEALILATRQHRIPEGSTVDFAADCALFLDMDISVLGAEVESFDRYEAGIAAEYRPHYPAEAYRAGRTAVLQGFIARDRLFLSETFAKLEAPARANLARSIAALEADKPLSALQGGEGERRWLTIIGIGEDGLAGLGAGARAVIDAAETLVGGERHLAMIPPGGAERLVWGRPIEATIAELLARRGWRVVVLASGDPMLYGIGATLARSVPPGEMTVLPAPGAFSLAAARLGWPLQNVTGLSLHGRPLDRLAWHLVPGARLLALTENGAAPAAIARWLVERGWGPSRLIVLERLGGAAERLTESTAEDFPPTGFADLNTLAIECWPGPAARHWSRLAGLPDEAFQHDGQLTKRAIRAATLAALAPCGGEILWDVGAGCGSIAIEWLRALEHGGAYAIERDPARCALIAANAATLGVPDLRIIQGVAPAALDGLPVPDAVFIGGGVDAGLLERCYAALKPGGRLVANAVTIEGEASLSGFHQARGGELNRLAVARAEPLGGHHAWRALAPVTQLACRKDPGQS